MHHPLRDSNNQYQINKKRRPFLKNFGIISLGNVVKMAMTRRDWFGCQNKCIKYIRNLPTATESRPIELSPLIITTSLPTYKYIPVQPLWSLEIRNNSMKCITIYDKSRGTCLLVVNLYSAENQFRLKTWGLGLW